MVEIRPAQPADDPELVALYQARPSRGLLSIAREPLDGGRLLEALLPGSHRYVAVGPDGVTVVGTTVVSTAPTQLNGDLVVGAYRWGTQVHPAFRGRGIGLALATRSWEEARAAGARFGWGIVERSNEASARTFRRLGFRVDRAIPARLILPGWHVARRSGGAAHRPATQADFPGLAEALNAHYAAHHLWRPLSAARLVDEAAALGTPDANLLLRGPSRGGRLAVAGIAVLPHAVRLRCRGRERPRSCADRLLRPPASVQLLRYAMLPGDPAAAGALVARLQRRHLRRALTLAANLDRLDPAWPACARLPALTLTLDLWVNSPEPLAPARPCWFT